MVKHTRSAGPAFLAVAVLLSACGGGSSGKPLAEESIATQTRVLRQHLVSMRMIEQARAGSLRRAFLDYWRTVQFADVDRAIDAYEPGLRDAIGAELLALALRNVSDIYQTQIPGVEETRTSGDKGVVRYVATTQGSGKQLVPLSTTWSRVNGRWRIRYSAALDSELRIAAQTRTQLSVQPGSERIDTRALRAGQRAATLQAAYLEQIATRGADTQP